MALNKEMLEKMGLSEEQISEILAENGKAINKVRSQLDSNKARLDELEAIEKEYNDYKDSQMTEAEKLNKALEAANAKTSEYNRLISKLKVEKVFASNGLTEEDYKDIIDSIVSEDSDVSEKLANNLVVLLNNKMNAKENEIKETYANKMPKPQQDSPQGSEDDATVSLVKSMVDFAPQGGDTSAFE